MEDVNGAVHSTGHKRCVIANENNWNCKCVSTKNRTCLWFHGWLGNVMFHCSDPPCFNEFSAKKGECGPDIISVNNGAYTSFCIQWSGNEHWAADVEQGLPVVWRLGNATSRGPNCTQLMTHLKGMMNPFQNTKKVTQPSLYLDMHHLDKPTPNSLTAVIFQDACFRGGHLSGHAIWQPLGAQTRVYLEGGGPMKFQLKWGMWVH